MQKIILISIFILTFFILNQVDCLSKFKSKKYFNKNINLNKNLPDAQWYDQRLNHFDESDKTTWKQVCA